MTLQSKSFELPARRGVAVLEKKLQKWLDDNEDIKVVSTDFTAYSDRIAFLLIYREEEQGTVSANCEVHEEPPRPQRTGPVPGGAPVAGALKEPEVPVRGIGTNALFGNFEAFNKK